MLILPSQCIIWNRNLPHFSPLHMDSFALTSLSKQGSGFGRTIVHEFFLLLVDVSTIPGLVRW